MTSEIIWTGSLDDQTARINDYVLRLESLNVRVWWWCVYFQDEVIASDVFLGKKKAKTACEKAYYEHLKTR